MTWTDALIDRACENCGSAFLINPQQEAQLCPQCFDDELDTVNEVDLGEFNMAEPPEFVIPFTITPEDALKSIAAYTMPVPSKPPGLKPEALRANLQRIYIPMYLIDGAVEALWTCELGAYYEVVSHNERFKAGQWVSEEKTETRTQWAPRAGTLKRTYENIPAPAINAFDKITYRLGTWDASAVVPFTPEHIADAFVQIPSRSPADSWRDAQSGFATAAGHEVKKAASADEIRSFSWKPTFEQHKWTQMLVPLYTTYYLDDNDITRVLFVHGQTGKAYGELRASLKAALPSILGFLAASAVTFVISIILAVIGFAIPVVGFIGLLGIVFAGMLILGAGGPFISVLGYNKKNHALITWLEERAAQ